MLLIINEKVYIQPIDIRFILDNYNEISIPDEIKTIKHPDNNRFIELRNLISIQFVLSDKNIIKLNDFVDMSNLEVHSFFKVEKDNLEKYIYDNLYDTIPRPLEAYANNKRNATDNILDRVSYILDAVVDNNIYDVEYVTNNYKKYPLELRNILYKYLNIKNVQEELFNTKDNICLTQEILTFHYSKKELQKIYYEILSDNLTKEELYPIKSQLYTIFTRINYTPEIQDIIISINRLNKDNDISFINDNLMQSLLKMYGFKTKFEQSAYSLYKDIYVMGYKFLSLDSARMLEVDIERIKNFLKENCTGRAVKEIEKYNLELCNIIKLLIKFNLLNINKIKKEIIYIMCAYFYLKIDVFDYSYDCLYEIINYAYNNLQIDFIDKKMFLSNNIYAFNVSASIFENLYKSNKEKVKIKQIENPQK